MMNKRKAELLAPAGSFDSLKAAVAAGADAIYMGGSRFGARAYAQNAAGQEMVEAIRYAHLHGCRLYMTVNTLFKEKELEELRDYMKPYYEAGLDGVIVQDLGALQVMKQAFPGMELHASTQMTVTSVYSAKMLKEMGCCRVVPARELSLEEISRIYKETGMDIETFVHGALCYCYSGQCLMSSLIGGRSGNRGRCAQPCRLPYRVWEGGKAEGKSLNKENQKFVLSLKDLCTLDILPDILEAGVYSLKIEGRMKSPRYTAGVVRIYRKYLDMYEAYGRDEYYVDPEDKKELLDLFDRGGFTSGYYEKHNGKDMVALKEKPEFREGNQKLFDLLDENYVHKEKKEPVAGKAVFEEGKPSVLELARGDVTVKVEGQICQSAQNQPATEEKVRKQLNKTGATSFNFEQLDIELKGNIFLPVQALNELRREGFEKLTEGILAKWERKAEAEETGKEKESAGAENTSELFAQTKRELSIAAQSASKKNHRSAFLTASLEEECQLEPALSCDAVKRIYIDADGFKPDQWGKVVKQCETKGKECFLTLPHIFRTHAMKFFSKNRKNLENAGFTGVLARALEEVSWLKEENIHIPFALDASVYAWNREAVHTLKKMGPEFITMPWELNSRELKAVATACEKEDMADEMIIYGHAPMMVSAQCVVKTLKGCTAKREQLLMKDRTGAGLPLKAHCSFCYNTILNPLPLSLFGSEEAVKELNLTTLRLSFTREGKEETKKILEAFAASYKEGRIVAEPVKDFTRGHFRRGVE